MKTFRRLGVAGLVAVAGAVPLVAVAEAARKPKVKVYTACSPGESCGTLDDFYPSTKTIYQEVEDVHATYEVPAPKELITRAISPAKYAGCVGTFYKKRHGVYEGWVMCPDRSYPAVFTPVRG